MGDEPPPPRQSTPGRRLVPPSEWFSPVVSDALLLPDYTTLERVVKPAQPRAPRAQRPKVARKRPPHTLRPRRRDPSHQHLPDPRRPVLPADHAMLAPLLTSYTEVGNFSAGAAGQWQTRAVRQVAQERLQRAAAAAPRSPPRALQIAGPDDGEVEAEDNAAPGCKSNVTVLLQPTTRQRLALDAMFKETVFYTTEWWQSHAVHALGKLSSGRPGPWSARFRKRVRRARSSPGKRPVRFCSRWHGDVGESAYDDVIAGLSKTR
jgi:hypothetical protein